jgi:hypothetical protein
LGIIVKLVLDVHAGAAIARVLGITVWLLIDLAQVAGGDEICLP